MGRAYANEIKSMRENRMTYDAIAKKLGLTRQNVWYTAKELGLTNSGGQCNKIIYKGVKNWMVKHKMNLHNFCIKCGEKYGASSKTYKFLIGEYKGDINVIGNILKVCGLTFDEAFGEVSNEYTEKTN